MNEVGDLKYWTLPLTLEPGYTEQTYRLAADSLIGSILAYEDKDTVTFDYLDEDIFNSLYNEKGETLCSDPEFLFNQHGYRQTLYNSTSKLIKSIMENNHQHFKELYGSVNISDLTVMYQNNQRLLLSVTGVKMYA